jgi:hypothetical protein
MALDSSRSAAEQLEAIEAAAAADQPPPLRWYLWATDILKFKLKEDARAAACLEQAVVRHRSARALGSHAFKQHAADPDTRSCGRPTPCRSASCPSIASCAG